ncbi:MAG: tRNA (adenosine(37)-N6)-threonylcarbamoyltransferase complex dimerization subunit type 1 TsaB [Acidimicrobiales bacterium]
MLILAVTSATASVGVAIVEFTDGVVETLAERQIATDRRHAEELVPMIATALETASGAAGRSITLGHIDRFAVDVGPGRFTGLRVGLATVRTLALANDTLVTGVSSLEALAAAHADSTVTAVVDARRAEVFQQTFTVDHAGRPVPLGDPFVGPPGDAVDAIGDDDLVVGDGADRYTDLYGDLRVAGCEPSPVVIARLAAERAGVVGSAVLPMYLRDPDVQINIKTRHNT